MLTRIKSGLAPSLSLEDPKTASSSSVSATEAKLAGARLLRGRTKAKVETLTAQVEDARKSLTDAKRTLGERMGDGEDTTSTTRTVKQAHDLLDALEAALVVAIQKDEAALDAVTQAKRQAAIQAEVAAVANLKRVGLKVDQLLTNLDHLVAGELVPAMNTARDVLSSSTIRPGELYFLAEAPSAFKQLLLLAVQSLIKEGFVPVNMRKYQQWSDCIPDEDFIRSRTREVPPTVKDIPSWQAGG